MKENKLMDAAIRLYHDKEEEQFKRVFEALNLGNLEFTNTNPEKIWHWGIARWGKDFSYREYEIREGA